MMDYYGSITMNKETIRTQLHTHFSDYSKNYIDDKMSKLKMIIGKDD
jgi:hypothetical protein